MSVIAAIASALRGEKYVHVDEESKAQKARLTVHALGVPGDDGIEQGPPVVVPQGPGFKEGVPAGTRHEVPE
jgi:hypothetical protein